MECPGDTIALHAALGSRSRETEQEKREELEGRPGEDVYTKNMLSYKTVTTVAQYVAFEKRGFVRAEQSPFSDPLGLGVIFEEELMDMIEVRRDRRDRI